MQPKQQGENNDASLPATMEEVLLLDGPVPEEEVNEILEILNGLSPDNEHTTDSNAACEASKNGKTNSSPSAVKEKRNSQSESAEEESNSNKKQKGEDRTDKNVG